MINLEDSYVAYLISRAIYFRDIREAEKKSSRKFNTSIIDNETKREN